MPDPTPPAVWWSASAPDWVITADGAAELVPLGGEVLDELPADAVRLIPEPAPSVDEMEGDFVDANERMGEALVKIGMALGLPRPRVGATWGAPAILARIAESGPAASLAGTAAPTGAHLSEMAIVIDEAIAHYRRFNELDEAWLAETAAQLRRFAALAAGPPNTPEKD